MHDKLGNCNWFCSKMAFEMTKSVSGVARCHVPDWVPFFTAFSTLGVDSLITVTLCGEGRERQEGPRANCISCGKAGSSADKNVWRYELTLRKLDSYLVTACSPLHCPGFYGAIALLFFRRCRRQHNNAERQPTIRRVSSAHTAVTSLSSASCARGGRACVRSALRQRVLRVGELSEKDTRIEGGGGDYGVGVGMVMLL